MVQQLQSTVLTRSILRRIAHQLRCCRHPLRFSPLLSHRFQGKIVLLGCCFTEGDKTCGCLVPRLLFGLMNHLDTLTVSQHALYWLILHLISTVHFSRTRDEIAVAEAVSRGIVGKSVGIWWLGIALLSVFWLLWELLPWGCPRRTLDSVLVVCPVRRHIVSPTTSEQRWCYPFRVGPFLALHDVCLERVEQWRKLFPLPRILLLQVHQPCLVFLTFALQIDQHLLHLTILMQHFRCFLVLPVVFVPLVENLFIDLRCSNLVAKLVFHRHTEGHYIGLWIVRPQVDLHDRAGWPLQIQRFSIDGRHPRRIDRQTLTILALFLGDFVLIR